jgi:regulatory protein
MMSSKKPFKKSKERTEPRKPRPPAKLTENGMFEAAMLYLQRFAAPEAQLRKVLERKVMRTKLRGGDIPFEVTAWIDKAVQKCVDLNFVDDKLFTDSKIRSMRRQGKARSIISQTLHQKGVGRAMIQDSLGREKDAMEEDGEDVELNAAIRTVQRKRLGKDQTPEARQKDLAKLLRGGFSMDVARRALATVQTSE